MDQRKKALSEYKVLLDLFHTVEKKLKTTVTRHQKQELVPWHAIGENKDCAGCLTYKKLDRRYIFLLNELHYYELKLQVPYPTVDTIHQEYTFTRHYMLYQIEFKDGSEFLVYAMGLPSACQRTKHTREDVRKHSVIPKHYWEGILIEGGNRSTVLTIAQLVERRKSKVIAKKAQSQVQYQGFAYNHEPFPYFKYSRELYKGLEQFCAPYKLWKTKKFNYNGRVGIEVPTGSMAIDDGTVLVKLNEHLFVAMTEKDFVHSFDETENLVWRVV